MNRITCFAATLSLAVSGAAHGGDLDGKVLICDLSGFDYEKTMFYFDGDKVNESHLSYELAHNDEYNFDYTDISVTTNQNIFYASPSQLFWCNVANVMEMGSPGSACQAKNFDDLASKALSSQMPGGTWTVVDRSSLEITVGAVVMSNFMDIGSGTCSLTDGVGKKEFWREEDETVKASKDEYKKKLEDAKAALENKKI